MSNSQTSFLRRYIPPAAWNIARDSYYRLRLLRFWRAWLSGLIFDLFVRQYRADGKKFSVPVALMKRAHRARFLHDTHEREERNMVKQWLPKNSTVLELGACLGVVSCVINRCLSNPRLQVAIEPNLQLLEVLKANRDMNSCGFAIENCLVSRASDGSFYLNDAIVMSSADQKGAKEIKVPVQTVEQLQMRHAMIFDAVFMDIQGGELGFMKENSELLARCHCVILEFHPHIIGEGSCEECRELLRSAGLGLKEKCGLVEAWLR